MKKIIISIVLVVGFTFAATNLVKVNADLSKATMLNIPTFYSDNNTLSLLEEESKTIVEPAKWEKLTPYASGVIVDSGPHRYTIAFAAGGHHYPINYCGSANKVVIINRAFSPSGNLNYHIYDVNTASFVHDLPFYQFDGTENMGARYPTAFAGSDHPYASFPGLVTGPAWGKVWANIREGWDAGQTWGGFLDLGPGDIKSYNAVGYYLPGDYVLIYAKISDPQKTVYRLTTGDLSITVDEGDLFDAEVAFSSDYNPTAGKGVIVAWDDAGSQYLYRTFDEDGNIEDEVPASIDGLGFLVPEDWADKPITWYVDGQVVVTDDGKIGKLVWFTLQDHWDSDNDYPIPADYPGYGYINYIPDFPNWETVYAPPIADAFMKQISLRGHSIATKDDYTSLIFTAPADPQPNNTNKYDVFMTTCNFNTSNDDERWTDVVNLTETSDKCENYAVAAPRLMKVNDSTYTAFVLYATKIGAEGEDDLWNNWYGGDPLDPLYLYMLSASVNLTGGGGGVIVNKEMEINYNISARINKGRALVEYSIPHSSKVKISLFDINGRKVHDIYNGNSKAGLNSVTFDLNEYAIGNYFVILKTDDKTLSTKLMVVR